MESARAKKVAASVTAVLQYAAEWEAAAAPPVATPATAACHPPPSSAPWGLAGRQDVMLLRALWQRRLTKSW